MCNKALPALPNQYMYEDPRALWIHHRKTSLAVNPRGGYEPVERCRPEHGSESQHREPSRGGNGLGIIIPDSYGPPRPRRAPPAYNTLPPTPEDS
ncbi:hypothetical protein IMZ48_03760 [Candidatus Bathyarchaeota archaeon]|nr:hypothetical protein [Candidatus Bathyarchaeota archaeon]